MPVLVRDLAGEVGERAARVDLRHGRRGADRVADVDRRGERPLLPHEDRAGAGQVHRHQRVEQACGDAALRDQPAEAGARGEGGVEVQRVLVARQLGKRAHGRCVDGELACRLLADLVGSRARSLR